MQDSDAFDALMERIASIEVERAQDIEAVAVRIRASAGADGDDVLDDQLADLKDRVSADCANAVADEDADDALEGASTRFADRVSNASLERRIAALLTVMDATDIGA